MIGSVVATAKRFFGFSTGAASAQNQSAGFPQAQDTRTNVGASYAGGGDSPLERGRQRLEIIEKARHLERSSSVAIAMLDRLVEMVIGTGLRPQARTDNKEWNRQAEDLINEWGERPEVRGLFDIYETQRLLVRGHERDGDTALHLIADGTFQLVEADRIFSPLGREYDPFHVGGIDLDPYGRPKTYYIVPRLDYEQIIFTPYYYPDRIKVRADHMLFWARRTRGSQTRGISIFAPNLSWFEHLDKFTEATVVAARMAACLGLLIEQPLPIAPSATTATSSGYLAPAFGLEPGMVKTLMPGERATTLKPEQPSVGYGEFLKAMHRQIGLPAGLPLEVLSYDFSNSSYSAARAAFLLARTAAKIRQQSLISQILKPLYRWRINMFIREGQLPPNKQAMKHAWVAPGVERIDPTKETEATLMAIDGGLTSYTAALAEQGIDFEELVAQRARENEILRTAGIEVGRPQKMQPRERNEQDDLPGSGDPDSDQGQQEADD